MRWSAILRAAAEDNEQAGEGEVAVPRRRMRHRRVWLVWLPIKLNRMQVLRQRGGLWLAWGV